MNAPATTRPTSAELRHAYTRDYFLGDCGGFETYLHSGGKALDPRLDCMARLARIRPPRPGMRVLDLGCGRGEMVRHFAALGCQVDAVDYAPDAIRLAEACFRDEPHLRDRVHLICASVTEASAWRGGYDLVLASDVIEHLAPEELDRLYALVARHLQPDGRFLIHTFPNHWYYRFGHPIRRRRAAREGQHLPEEPRSEYERKMHINEQTPPGLRRQLGRYFPHVLLWAGDHQTPQGSLARRFGLADWREAPSLFAVAGHESTAPGEILAALDAPAPRADPEPPTPVTPVPPAAVGRLRRGVHRLRRHPRLRAVIDRLHALYRLPHHVHTLKTLQEEQARLGRRLDALAAEPAGQGGAGGPGRLEAWYQDFEDHFRGPPQVIRDRLRVYLPHLEGVPIGPETPLLDLGCGRGDWLSLLAQHGHPAEGVDLNPQALEQARAQGCRVRQAPVLERLAALETGSHGAITAFHLVEHLPFEAVLQLIDEAWRVLLPGGLLILETPNPENLAVGACHFHTDPTHRHPLIPAVLEFTLARAGFASVHILRLNPDLPEHHLSGRGDATAHLNRLLHGPRDYAVLGRKPGPAP
ncbi:methyltransferase domain-containing protein [Ectothiorhodospira mobilis]|uniref:methyltransferase domain-containing protein n=1 Tax=Ectothiorhodospira mobilis TaxID=195064 RepID=UPI001EE958DA|nr:methyltransferase domain-containing protein [Ectothiorhodospira mobilis]MCG5534670.1 class I SAM-dependent methyltransferase [Ectothiorhodospira mobilis]